MKLQTGRIESISTIAALAYELNAVATAFAAEAERLGGWSLAAEGSVSASGVAISVHLHGLIEQLHEVTLALRYARHSGHPPPPIATQTG
jgi:hypothetical protein